MDNGQEFKYNSESTLSALQQFLDWVFGQGKEGPKKKESDWEAMTSEARIKELDDKVNGDPDKKKLLEKAQEIERAETPLEEIAKQLGYNGADVKTFKKFYRDPSNSKFKGRVDKFVEKRDRLTKIAENKIELIAELKIIRIELDELGKKKNPPKTSLEEAREKGLRRRAAKLCLEGNIRRNFGKATDKEIEAKIKREEIKLAVMTKKFVKISAARGEDRNFTYSLQNLDKKDRNTAENGGDIDRTKKDELGGQHIRLSRVGKYKEGNTIINRAFGSGMLGNRRGNKAMASLAKAVIWDTRKQSPTVKKATDTTSVLSGLTQQKVKQ